MGKIFLKNNGGESPGGGERQRGNGGGSGWSGRGPRRDTGGEISPARRQITATFKVGAIALAFLIIGYEAALFVHRASVLRIQERRDHPDTVFVYSGAESRHETGPERDAFAEKQPNRHGNDPERDAFAEKQPNRHGNDPERDGFAEKQLKSHGNGPERDGYRSDQGNVGWAEGSGRAKGAERAGRAAGSGIPEVAERAGWAKNVRQTGRAEEAERAKGTERARYGGGVTRADESESRVAGNAEAAGNAGGGMTAVRKDGAHPPAVEAVRRNTRRVESFRFNPNTVSVEDLQRLGFSAKQAASIDNYRAKGGKFRRPSDFAKSFVVSDSVFRRLKPFIDIPRVDINAADSAAFDALPGIGAWTAAEMVRYREALGGYSCCEQLMDVYRFDRSRYEAISDLIFCGPGAVPFDLWGLPAEDLRRHPCIRTWSVARAIVLYRSNTPPSEWTLAGLQGAGILDSLAAARLGRCLLVPAPPSG